MRDNSKKITNSAQADTDFSGLPYILQERLRQASIVNLTPIQKRSFEAILSGRDLFAQSPTGTGKTLAFCLPLYCHAHKAVQQISRASKPAPKIVVIAPTRELVQQISAVFKSLFLKDKVKIAELIGGESFDKQMRYMRFGVDIILGTPGRICEFIRRDAIKLRNVRHLVLDEVDHLLEIGFEKELNYIHKNVSSRAQIMVFAATVNRKTKTLAHYFLRDPIKIDAEEKLPLWSLISHRVFNTVGKNKFSALMEAFDTRKPERGLIFCNKKSECFDLEGKMRQKGYRVAVINGDLEQTQRQIAMRHLKQKRVDFLIATNVAARGIDIEQLPLVINYSLARSTKDFVHRVGRTGRAGKKGEAWNFVSSSELQELYEICHRVGIKKKNLEIVQ